MKVILAFFTSLSISFGSLFGYLTLTNNPKPDVLSLEVQASPSQTLPASLLALTTSIPADSPTSSPTASPSVSASPKKTPSPTPTPTKSPTPTPSPTPTVTASPTTSPTSTPDVVAPASMEPFFIQYSAQYNVNKNVLERIADCESHFNPNAVSPDGNYVGMFQFSSSKWTSKRNQMILDNNPALRTNIEESIKTAAFTVSVDGTSSWPNCV